jgi:hypothetical protein
MCQATPASPVTVEQASLSHLMRGSVDLHVHAVLETEACLLLFIDHTGSTLHMWRIPCSRLLQTGSDEKKKAP